MLITPNHTDRVGYNGMNKIIDVGDFIYCVYQEINFNNYICKINKNTDEVIERFLIDGGTDNHGGLSLAIDKNGYIHLVGGSHNNDLNYYISKQPYMLDFTKSVIANSATYPMICIYEDEINIIYRTWNETTVNLTHLTKKVNDNNFASKILAIGSVPNGILPSYALTFNSNNLGEFILVCEWYYNNPIDKSVKEFVLTKSYNSNSWTRVGGNIVDSPLTISDFDFEGKNLWHTDVVWYNDKWCWVMNERDVSEIYFVCLKNNVLSKVRILNDVGSDVWVNTLAKNNDNLLLYINSKSTNLNNILMSDDEFKTYIYKNIGYAYDTIYWTTISANEGYYYFLVNNNLLLRRVSYINKLSINYKMNDNIHTIYSSEMYNNNIFRVKILDNIYDFPLKESSNGINISVGNEIMCL